MKIGIVVYSNDSETVWNAFRFANFALNEGDEINVFLLGKGVECESPDTDKLKVTEQMQTQDSAFGGTLHTLKTLVKIHLPLVNTHLPTPHLPALTQAHDLNLADAADFSQGWDGWGCRNGVLMFV